MIELRRYECPNCHSRFWVDCDDMDYPEYCPFCGVPAERGEFIRSVGTVEIEDVK